ncbi:hypothetical protein BCR36DRAFT_319166 [Piromyces finnis]|uniref:SUN domain-containing protein n=1 Tax=Piromyces finnis TaxID=1754191 RepID=A0A1Y1VI90_9FUNG|nr:hypothetical protein BCR36DRAFT_319166 [Piromyces finnis]|eukprot:ORX57117.1 hypothetical protein BCR36DRAFT_319166 [Piromyces finnis]
MEDYVHYQEKFSGNACKNEYYYFNNEEYFKRLFDQKLTCSIRLEDKLKIKSNEKNKININNNSNSNNKSNYNNNKNINDNNNNKHVINEVVKERMQTIELLEKIYSQKNEEDDIISTTTIDSSYQESDKEDKSNYSISSSEGPMETPNVIDDKKGNDEDFISSLMEEKVTATTTLFEQSDEKKDHQEKDINVTQTPNNQDHQNSNEETSSFIKDKENIKYEIPTTENEDKVEKEKDTQLVDEVNEEKEEITTGIDIDDKKEKETIENENLNINESEKEYYDNNVENKTNIINNKNETESEKINTQSTSGENEKNSNKSSNSKYKNRFLSYFLRDGQSKVKKPKPIPSMEDDIIYSVKDLKLTGKEHFNFASLDCAAAVLKSNPELKMANAILNESKDSYSNNICQAKEKFVIIELCEDILIDRIILGNFEYFSSMYKDVKVSISSRYPPKDGHWKLLAFLRATNSRDIQVFKIKKPLSYVKYVRFDFLSYYGYEYFCPLSLIRIHGRTMMDEFIEDEGKLEEEVIIETPTYPYLQPGHPFLTLPSSSNSHESSPFEDAFPFLSSDSFLSDTSSNSKVQTNSRVTSHSKSSTSTSSSSTKGDNSDKGSTNINLFSLFVKQYNNQLITNKNDYSYETSPTTRATRQTKTNPSTTTTPNDIEEELTNESNINNSNEEEDDDKVNNDNENQPPLHESVFKTIMRRLTALERNTTLSFKYLEEQGKIFNQYILYLNKKQQTSLKQLIKDNNMMYDNNLHALKNEFDSNWKEMWNELQINKQIYYDTIKQIAFKIENIEQSYDNRMFALLLIIIFNKLIWIIIKKMWSLLFRFSSKSKRRYSNTRIKQKNDYYYLESDDSFSSLNNINTSNYEDFVRRKSPLSNNIKYSSSSPNTPPAKLKRKKMLRKIPSYTNAVHMNRYEHINNHIYGPGTNYAQSIGHIQSRASNSTGSSRRNSSVEFSTNDLLRKSQRLPPQTSTLLSSASSILQAKKLLHTLYHQKPPLSPNSSYSNKKFDSLIDNIDGASSSSTNGTNINNNSNNNNNSLSTNPKLKHHYSSPRSTYLSMPSKDIEKNMKKKEKVKDNSSVSSQSDDNNNNGDDEDDEDEDDVKEIAGTIKESEHKKNKGNYHSHTSAASHCPLGISTQPDTTTDNNNSNSEIEEVKEKKELKDEKGNHSITLSKISNENMPVITTTKVKGIKSNSLPINSYMHSSTHHGQNYNHSGNRVKLTSSPISMATAATTVTSTETPSTSMKNSHRSGVRLPSINTSKLGLPSSSSKSPNASSIINSTPIIDYPVSAPIDTNHPTSTMDSVNTPSSAPLHLHHYDDLSNIYTNMILSSLSSTSKERSRIHRNYNFIGNKHILRRKRTNLVRSPASFPSLNINRMNNK